MKHRRAAAILGAFGMLLAGCASSSPTPHERSPEPTAKATPAAAEAPVEPAIRPAPIAAPPLLGRDHHSVVACSSNADCGWDNPCMPTRCVEAGAPRVCDESGAPPGECSCLEGACTTKPSSVPAPSHACEPRACMVDRAAGRCVADDGGVAEGLRGTPGVNEGPSCDCIEPAKGCTFTWFEPVPCKTERDCWISPSPRRHPVARPRALRKRDFRPCADGEVAPRCGENGQCVLGLAYSC